MQTRRFIQAGFTLVEMIIVMVITGIIGGMVAMFIKAPVQQYVDAARRAELTDIADTAFIRLARDIRTAVPNSVRVSGTCPTCQVEFLPTKTGGRYRANAGVGIRCGAATAANEGDALSFAGADTCFEVIGSAVSVTSNDYLVVGSTQSDAVPPYDTTAASGVLRPITASGVVQTISLSGAQLPAFAQLDSQRFQVIDGNQQAVTYACESPGTNAAGDGTGVLRRYWHYGFAHALGATSAVLADSLSSCNFNYDIVNQRNALLAITLQFTKASETISLYQEIHVSNAP
jgi:MSHA biogenesis protein MshO